MVAQFAPLLLGAALGGGGSSTLTNTGTFTTNVQNEFLPVANFNVGGSVSARPTGGYFGAPNTQASAGVSPAQGANFPNFGVAGSRPQSGFNIMDNLPLIGVGLAALYFITKG